MSRRNTNKYEHGLEINPANYAALTPLTYIERSAKVYPNHIAMIRGQRQWTWAETYARARRLASALSRLGVGIGDTVAFVAPNGPALFEAHFGVPMVGAVLNAINVRLDAGTIAYILDHGEAKVLITDREFSATVKQALSLCEHRPIVIDIDDEDYDEGEWLGEIKYEAFLEGGDPKFVWASPANEWQAITLNYTSGTTGRPKGVVYHHRGAALNAMGNALAMGIAGHPTFVWTLPLFHCNGWCFSWTMATMAGTSIFLRRVDPERVLDCFEQYEVSHFAGAPIVLNMLVQSYARKPRQFRQKVQMMVGGAAPPAAVIDAVEKMGATVTHAYGLTETYGPAVSCAWHTEWNDLPLEQRAFLKGRCGVRHHVLDGLAVKDPLTMQDVPADSTTIGEVMFRGNIVMKGYLKNKEATTEAFAHGWFHSGDLAVVHPDGYIKIVDRSKDLVISGAENISSLEVEDALYKHPAVLEAAVVARPDNKWGETPCAFVTLKEGAHATAEDLIAFTRERIAHFKAPKSIVFGPLPKTSTGKIQKFLLRQQARELGSLTYESLLHQTTDNATD